jgi:hypothetical protein
VANTRIAFAQKLVDGCLKVLPELVGIDLYTYQMEMADRILFSLIYGDAEEITIEATRQGGKSEALADISATAMVILPKLAAIYPQDPILRKFITGIEIGCFGPIDEQADTIFGRIHDRLTSPHAKAFLSDPEINDDARLSGNVISMANGSLCRRQTAHAKAKIESKTYHLIIIDEAQDADASKVRKSIHPMLTATAGSIVKVGTPAPYKSDYYEAILRNKRRGPTNQKRNHFAYDYRRASKENPYYAQAIKKEKARLGEDSDEFQMSYNLKWLLDRGMFITEEQLEELGDKSMQIVPYYTDSPIVIGIDVARKHDSTLATALWVDWEHPDEFGLFNHRILSWLELHGENWESQYRQICEFASHYYVMRIGVDAQGMGGPVAERLQVLLPNIEVVAMDMNPIDQSERWGHLMQLIQRGLIGWPAHSRTRRTRQYQRFIQQMSDVEKEYRGKYLLVGAPKNEKNAHDDYIDSLALACSLTKDYGQQMEVQVWNSNPLLERGIRAG